jgi:hypothetical protein
MLTEAQAKQIVWGSIQKTGAACKLPQTYPAQTDQSTLQDLGLAGATQQLAITIVSDPEAGVTRLQHYLDPNELADLPPGTTVADLTEKVRLLAAGKLCSNPASPHPQECCPYPAFCPQCGFPVR